MNNILFILFTVLAGAGISLQAAMNARLGKAIGQPIVTSAVSFLVGLVLLAALGCAGVMGRVKLTGLHEVPWWGWLGGLFGALYVTTAVVGVPKIGTAVLICAVVCGQLIAALVLDAFGWVGVPRVPISAWRVGGAVLLVIAVLMMQKR